MMHDDLDNELERLKAYAHWLYGLAPPPEQNEENKELKGMDLVYIKYAPRWKWFRPPMWKIFMWAYKVVNIYHTGISSVDIPNDPKGEESNE